VHTRLATSRVMINGTESSITVPVDATVKSMFELVSQGMTPPSPSGEALNGAS
jgi:hypothetical protein